jgi:hypothetical protein
MTLFSYINKNFDRVKHDVKAGIIPCSILRHFEIYSKLDYYRRNGYPDGRSIDFLVFDFKLNERTVYRIIKKMEAEI